MTSSSAPAKPPIATWESLGLLSRHGSSTNEVRQRAAELDALTSAWSRGEADPLALAAVAAAARVQVATEIADEDRARAQRGRRAVLAAASAPDADNVVATGEWAGFSRARALGWCWNLYQYEPHGFTGPGAQLRHENLRRLENGDVPDGFGYAARARVLEAEGLTPRSYREFKEKLGARTYSPADVRQVGAR